MDLLRRTARGELAEIFGNNALEEDKRHGLSASLKPPTQRWPRRLQPHVRSWRPMRVELMPISPDSKPKSLPPEFQILQYQPRPWTPSDSLVVVKLFFESLSNTWRLDVMREAFADLPAEKRAALMPVTSPLDVLVVGNDTRKTAVLSTGFLLRQTGRSQSIPSVSLRKTKRGCLDLLRA